MNTIKITLDDELLAAADAQAARAVVDRFLVIQEALRDHLRRLKIKETEEQERLAYQRVPATIEDEVDWEKPFACAEY